MHGVYVRRGAGHLGVDARFISRLYGRDPGSQCGRNVFGSRSVGLRGGRNSRTGIRTYRAGSGERSVAAQVCGVGASLNVTVTGDGQIVEPQ